MALLKAEARVAPMQCRWSNKIHHDQDNVKQSALPNQVLMSGTKSKLGTVLIDLTCATCPSWLDDMSLGDTLP